MVPYGKRWVNSAADRPLQESPSSGASPPEEELDDGLPPIHVFEGQLPGKSRKDRLWPELGLIEAKYKARGTEH